MEFINTNTNTNTSENENFTPQIVRETCLAFSSPIAFVSESAIDSFVNTFSIDTILDFATSPTGLSTNSFTSVIPFPTLYDEAGFLFLSHAIDFGSGFRKFLHQYRHGQGAWLTIRDGLIKLGNANPICDSIWLKNLSLLQIEEFFDLSFPELKLLAQYIHDDLHEIGTVLDQLGYTTPGQFIQSNLSFQACGLVNLFVHLFPVTFRDEYVVNEQRVCLFKKAQLVVSEIFLRFSPLDTSFQFKDINILTAFVDNVVVAMLRKYQIIECVSELNERIENEVYLEKGSEEEVSLRASGIKAVEMIVVKFNQKQKELQQDESEGKIKEVNSQLVCNWLWGGLGKEGENRKFPRHLSPSTSYY